MLSIQGNVERKDGQMNPKKMTMNAQVTPLLL